MKNILVIFLAFFCIHLQSIFSPAMDQGCSSSTKCVRDKLLNSTWTHFKTEGFEKERKSCLSQKYRFTSDNKLVITLADTCYISPYYPRTIHNFALSKNEYGQVVIRVFNMDRLLKTPMDEVTDISLPDLPSVEFLVYFHGEDMMLTSYGTTVLDTSYNLYFTGP